MEENEEKGGEEGEDRLAEGERRQGEEGRVPPRLELGGEVGTEWRELDPDVVGLWRLNQLISSTILLLMTGLPAVILAFSVPQSGVWLLAGWLALLFLRMWLLVWHPWRAYRAWGYRLDGKVLEIKYGIFFRVIQLLPLSRLQHADLHRGPLERYYGLATLLLYTAGTQEAVLTIPGLAAEEAERLRDQLVAIGGGDDAV